MLLKPDGRSRQLLTVPGNVGVGQVSDSGPYIILRRQTIQENVVKLDEVLALDPLSRHLFGVLSSHHAINGFDVIQAGKPR